jgi:hypothetical protein
LDEVSKFLSLSIVFNKENHPCPTWEGLGIALIKVRKMKKTIHADAVEVPV